jgi:hypothetical protein
VGCKHEGGTDPCVRYKCGQCKVHAKGRSEAYRKNNSARCKAYREANRERILGKTKAYHAANIHPGSRLTGQRRGRSTAAGEALAQCDLLRRGFEVTKPLSPTAKHDLHVDLPSVGWKGVQVKVARLNIKTGRLGIPSKAHSSPIYALVHPPTMRIEYRPGTEPLPQELTTELETSIREFELWRDTSTSAARAKASRLKEATSTQPKETTNSVPNAGSN